MIILSGFVLALAGILVLMSRTIKMREVEMENKMIQSYMESMEEFYAVMQERIEAVRRYRHDLAKHIRTLEKLLENSQKKDGTQEYMEDLKERYTQLRKEEYCADEVVNSILSIKKEQCEVKKIPFEIQVEDTTYGEIRDVDMVGLLHNLLDNAVEAEEHIPQEGVRGIYFSMGKKDGNVWIDVENYICPGEKVVFKTKKEVPEDHGIGTKIIDSLIHKYDGKKEITVDPERHLFVKKIVLCGTKTMSETDMEMTY